MAKYNSSSDRLFDRATMKEPLINQVKSRTGGFDIKNTAGKSSEDIQNLMKDMNFSEEQIKAFNNMHAHYQGLASETDITRYNNAQRDYNKIKEKIDNHYNNATSANYSEEAHSDVNALSREKLAMEEKIKNIKVPSAKDIEIDKKQTKWSGKQYSESRGEFLEAMGHDSAALSKFNAGLKNLEPVSNGALNKVEEGLSHMGGKFGKFAKIGVGAMVGLGLVQALSDNRGQQSNNQLYGGGM